MSKKLKRKSVSKNNNQFNGSGSDFLSSQTVMNRNQYWGLQKNLLTFTLFGSDLTRFDIREQEKHNFAQCLCFVYFDKFCFIKTYNTFYKIM